jgi:O-antigen/teichoic acid export membrane protein
MVISKLKEAYFLIRNNLVISNFLNYYLFSLISVFIGLFSISFLSNTLAPEEYGYVGIYNSILFFVPAMISFSGGGLQSIEIIKSSNSDYVKFRNSLLLMTLFNSLIVLFFVSIFYSLLSKYIFIIYVAIIMGTLLSLTSIHNVELINDMKSKKFGLFSALNQILVLLFSFVFLKLLNFGWEFRLFSFILAEILVLVPRFFIFSSIARDFSFAFDALRVNRIYTYGTPLILYTLLGTVLHQSDRFFLLKFFTVREVGFYTVAAGLSSVIVMINSNFDKVLMPFIYKKLDSGSNIRSLNRVSSYYSIMILVIALCYSLFLKYFSSFFLSPKYNESLEIAYILNFAQAFLGIYSNRGMVVDFYKKNVQKTAIFLLCVVFLIILNFHLIPFLSSLTSAWSLLISFMLLSIIVTIYSNYLLKKHDKIESKEL